jgi:hypothetical protein
MPQLSHAVSRALRKIVFIGRGQEVVVRLAVGDGYAQRLFNHGHVIHSYRIVAGEECTLYTDVAAEALLKTVLHRLYASP